MQEFNFEEIYNQEFGSHGTAKFSYNSGPEFAVLFTTPNHTEDSVVFAFPFGTYMVGLSQPGKQYLSIFDENGNMIDRTSRRFTCFVNLSGEFPPLGGNIDLPPAREFRTHLLPNKQYKLIVTREFWHVSPQSYSLQYTGQDGGEQPIEYPVEVKEMVWDGIRYIATPVDDE